MIRTQLTGVHHGSGLEHEVSGDPMMGELDPKLKL